MRLLSPSRGPLAVLLLTLALTPTALAASDRPDTPSSPTDGEVPIEAYFVDPSGRARIRVASSPERYYVLYLRQDPTAGEAMPVSLALGQEGSILLTEQLAAHPVEHYHVEERSVAEPGDLDGDGIDDLTELREQAQNGRLDPLNPAAAIDMDDGTTSIPDRETFEALSYEGREVLIDTHLEDLEFVKFYLLDMDTDRPRVYFMNTVTHRSHGSFARAVGIGGGGGRPPRNQPGQMRGEIVYHPHVIGPNGTPGVYRFEFEPNDSYPFAEVARAYELFGRSMPVLANDLVYYPMPNAALPRYQREKALYDASRVAILLEEDIYAEVDYLPLNLAEGYGLLRHMADPNERPGSRDIVLYEALPNDLPRVGGIITTIPQTPLSHVNLRAIQDGLPNAYIKGALQDETIAGLLDKHVYYRVGAEAYEIREASLAEVEAHYASLRPSEPQLPGRDLGQTEIAALDAIGFADWPRFGVKAANLAEMRGFGFPEGTINAGFAVPFHFYDAFMTHNGFYDRVRALLADPDFQSDYDVQEAALEDLRDAIEDGEMPDGMLEALAEMQAAFPEGASIRCRSSTNNEDLPGFSGAGLYDSYTHRPDEGHIAKSIKQVYASLWNFRAFDEREFYRIDHFQTAMGVLVHENFDDEQANGVGVTTDPFYQSTRTYYLNTQVGEDLVTNPEQRSVPEEILLSAEAGGGYVLVRPSNQLPAGRTILTPEQLEAMRGFLETIQTRFAVLYEAEDRADFAMEIEYKLTAEGQMAIKQARPWVFQGILGPAPAPTVTPRPTETPRPTVDPTPSATARVAAIYLPLLQQD